MRVEMNFANTLAVVTVISGLPTTLLLFFNDQVVVGVLVALLVVGVVGGVLFWRWHTNQPIVTFLNHEKTLTFEDRDAHRATQVSKMRVRANYRGVQRLKMGTVRGDGPVRNILIDGQPPTHTEEVLGAKEVYKAFNPPLGYREERDIEATLLWEDSYPNATEGWSHTTGHKTKKLSMKIVFHPDRTCRNVWATMSYAGETHGWLTEKVVVTSDRREVTLEVPKPKLGAEYLIEWDW